MAPVRAQYHRWLTRDIAPVADPGPAPTSAPDSLDALWTALHDLRAAEVDVPDATAERVLLGYAPTALLAGPALFAASHVRHADRELGAACLDALFLECGEGDAARHRGNLYRALLADHGLALPDPASPRFIADERLRDEDFTLALVGADPSADIQPEALGHHAAAIVLGPPPAVRRLAPHARYVADASHHTRAQALTRRCLAACAAWPRIWHGALRLAHARQTWTAALQPNSPSAWHAMHDLVARKAPHASGHHRRILLKNRTLDEWFAEDPTALLEMLARSSWVVPGDPDRSPLATNLVEFGGPMFGVFTPEDQRIVRAWILAQGAPRSAASPAPPTPSPVPFDSPTPPRWSASQLYHRLMRPGPLALSAAHDHVTRVLRATRDLPRHFPRTPRDLTPWVDARLREQVTAADEPSPDLTRDEVIWLLTQLAPAALVDGAWLQGLAAPALSSSPAAALLLAIYRDELGAGVTRQHHGNVMRATLQTLGVQLPPCDSPAFLSSPSFVPQAFAMPALWLAIAAHSATFLPELLGLNLAIEMAGIGSGYRRAIGLLRHHAIDPYFFVLHNTIDNAASGHTAWSTRAIDHHMDTIAIRDDLAISREWRRIRRGYLAYDNVGNQLVRALALRLGPRLGLRWLRRRLTSLTTRAGT